MDDEEDYRALFFTECEELLADLQEHLDRLTDGDDDPETVNAAFRAVHSVKGGAAAFGFSDLIGFAHVFETVMDGIRSGRIELAPDVSHALVRAGDAMAHLVELARGGGGEPDALVARVLGELEEISDAPAPPSAAPEPLPAEPEPPAAAAETRELTFRFAPGPEFLVHGHDPLRVIRAARDFGLVSVEAEGAPPAPDMLDPELCCYAWRMTFDTDRGDAEIEAFFDLYRPFARIERIAPADPLGAADPAALQAPFQGAPDEPAADAQAASPPETGDAGARAKDERKPDARSGAGVSKSLRVELSRVDRLVNLVGEIVITQAVLAQKLSETDASAMLEVGHSVEALNRQTRELQESVMAIRAQPVKSVFSRMPRIVRDLSDTLGKQARLTLSGEHTEVDTTVIEELAEPLTHMLRNSMDHGLESPEERIAAGKPPVGEIELSAEHRGERVIIILRDDGRGIDRDRVLAKALERGLVEPGESLTPEEIDGLIFHPGFSTSDEVSSVSGRGVGMDVVKRKIQSLGGRCALRSEPGRGAEFIITLPLTLAVLDGMTVRVGEDRFILPLSSVIEALRLEDCDSRDLPDGTRLLRLRGEYLRMISLRGALNLSGGPRDEAMAVVADTETDGHVALLVDELLGQRQVVLKSLEANFRRVDGVSGATILGDGRVALILDVPSLVELGARRGPTHRETIH